MKKNQDGIVHHLALLLVGVVVLSAIGFAGFRIYKSKNNISAKAASYSILGQYSGAWIGACRPNNTTIKFVITNNSTINRFFFWETDSGVRGSVRLDSRSGTSRTYYNASGRVGGGVYNGSAEFSGSLKWDSVVKPCP